MKIVFMGTPDFAVRQADRLLEEEYDIELVVTQPDRRANRGKVQESPVKKWAVEKGIEVAQPLKLRSNIAFKEQIEEIKPDFIVVSAYGSILPKEILEIPKFFCINVHASLLPKYRGASPIQQAILRGDEKSGVSIMKMEEGLDTGPVFAQKSIEIAGRDYPELDEALSELGARLLADTLKKISDGEIEALPQDDAKSSYAGIIKKSDGLVKFDRETAGEIERKIRAFRPWPGACCLCGGEKIKIWEGIVIDREKYSLKGSEENFYDVENEKLIPGCIVGVSDEGIDISCLEGILRIRELQSPGKKRMDAGSYLRGHKILPGTLVR